MKGSFGISDFLEEISSLSHSVVENFACNMQTQVQLPDRKTRWRRAWQPTPVFLPGEYQGQRKLADFNGSQRATNTTEQPTLSLSLSWGKNMKTGLDIYRKALFCTHFHVSLR